MTVAEAGARIRLALHTYDASYLWVARSRDAELVALDDTLQRVAQS